MSEGPFQQRKTTALVVVCVVSFLGLGLLSVFGPDFEPTTSGDADAYSNSAVGHGALYHVLLRMGVPVLLHRNPARPALGREGLLLILEPHLHLVSEEVDRAPLQDRIAGAPAVLLALPKWQVMSSKGDSPYVETFAPWQAEYVLGPLEALGIEARLVRPQLDPDEVLEPNPYEAAPSYPSRYRQLIASTDLEPLIGDADGMLLGQLEFEGVPVYVLSDPDLLQTQGIGLGRNAELVMTWIDDLRDGGPVAFDETLHGFPAKEESLMRAFFRFPLVLVLLHVVFVVALLLWAGLSRFGDAPAPPPSVEPGSGFLIRHTAYLLRFTRHPEMALRRYVEDTAREVALRYRLPADLQGAELDARLDALGTHRGIAPTWSQLKTRVLAAARAAGRRSDGGAMRTAQDLHLWKQEILDGTRGRSRQTQPVA